MNTPEYFPGTVVPFSEIGLLAGIFTATNGITLSQVCEITGLEPGTVQNWIKRGYVNPPVGRKYLKEQVARIILINLLRETFTIEKIANVLSYINGNLLDRSDDIMYDSDIYQCLCDILKASEEGVNYEDNRLSIIINERLKDYQEPYKGAKDKLILVFKAMVCAYGSAILKKHARDLTEQI